MPEVKVGLALVGPDTPPLPPSPEPRNPQVKLDSGYPKKVSKVTSVFQCKSDLYYYHNFFIETRLKDHLKGSSA